MTCSDPIFGILATSLARSMAVRLAVAAFAAVIYGL